MHLPEVEKYLVYLKHLAHESLLYVEIITSMYLMQQAYLGWADFHLLKGNVRPHKHKGWIVLHSGDEFTSWENS